jgi:ABC-type spermidine/putrescine transport system permease subunit I
MALHRSPEEPALRPPADVAAAAHPVSERFIWGLLLMPAAALLVPFFASVALLIRYSFNTWSSETGMMPDLALGNYATMLGAPYYLGVLLNTLKLGAITTAIALVMGYPVAYAITLARRRHVLLLMVVVPLWMDVLIRAFGWIVILDRYGLVNNALVGLNLVGSPVTILGTPLAVVLDLLHETLPFMIVTLFSILQRLDPTLRDAAMGLGANRPVTFWKVTLPLSLPGMIASTTLTFSLAISAFAGPLILGAGKVPMMSLLIFQQMTFGMNWALGSAQAVTLMTIVLSMLIAYTFLIRRLPAGQ